MLRKGSRREPVPMRTTHTHRFTSPVVRENPRPAPDPKAAASLW